MRNLRLGLAALLSHFFLCHVSAQDLILTTENYPPFNIVDSNSGAITGISTEKVRELMRRSGEKYSLNAYPWTRSFQMVLNNTNTCIFSISRTPKREQLFKWIGILRKSNWIIFARSDDTRTPKTLSDLTSYVIGTSRNDAIDNFLSGKGFKTDLANTDSHNPQKLLKERFDFWATEEWHGKSILEDQKLTQKVIPLFQFHQSIMYLACNKDMKQDRANKLERILKEMADDGTSVAIEKKYWSAR